MTRARWMTVPLALLAAAPAVRGDVADVAELFPAGTLAYAEIGNPAATAGVIGGWAKGTPLEDGIRLVQDRKDAIKDIRAVGGQLPVGVASLLVSPEFLREVGRFRGAAVGLTGFTEAHEPQAAAVVLFGDSSAGGLLARSILATNRDLRRVDTVDGVPVLQARAFAPPAFGNDGKPLPLENPKPTEGRFEPTYAYRPGLFVVGTNKAAVADVLARFAGKGTTPGLAGEAGFKRLAADRAKPGIFFYAVPPALARGLTEARKADHPVVEGDVLAALQFVGKPETFPVVSGGLELDVDAVSLWLRAGVVPGRSSPLLGLFAGTAGRKFATGMPPAAAAAVTLALPPPAETVGTILEFADACAKAAGALGPPPSEQAADVGKRVGIDLRGDVIRRVAGVTLVIPERQELPRGVSPLPLLACHTDSPTDAEALAGLVPKLACLLTGAERPPDTTVETIQGLRVWSLPGTGVPNATPIHYAAAGPVVVLGLDRQWVARLAAIKGGAEPAELRAGEGEPDGGVAVLGRFRFGGLARLSESGPPGPGDRPRVPATPADQQRDAGQLSADPATALLDSLPLAVLTIGVGKDGLRVELAVRGFRPKLAALVEKLVVWLERAGAEATPADGLIPRGQLDR